MSLEVPVALAGLLLILPVAGGLFLVRRPAPAVALALGVGLAVAVARSPAADSTGKGPEWGAGAGSFVAERTAPEAVVAVTTPAIAYHADRPAILMVRNADYSERLSEKRPAAVILDPAYRERHPYAVRTTTWLDANYRHVFTDAGGLKVYLPR
jgi:hypothetical protein